MQVKTNLKQPDIYRKEQHRYVIKVFIICGECETTNKIYQAFLLGIGVT